jgi:hypothetical protein
MLGVHTDSLKMKSYPSGDQGVYGLSIHNNNNAWITTAGSTSYGGDITRKISPHETI